MSAQLLAIEIGGSKLQLFVGEASGRIVHRQRCAVNPAEGGAGSGADRSHAGRLAEGLEADAIGIGFGGPVDRHTGNICCSHQVEGWSDFPLGDWLARLSGLPVVVEND